MMVFNRNDILSTNGKRRGVRIEGNIKASCHKSGLSWRMYLLSKKARFPPVR